MTTRDRAIFSNDIIEAIEERTGRDYSHLYQFPEFTEWGELIDAPDNLFYDVMEEIHEERYFATLHIPTAEQIQHINEGFDDLPF